MLRRIFPDEFVAIAVALAVALGLGAFGCNDTPSWKDPGPAAAFNKFLMDWFTGDRDAAFEAIAPADRKILTAPLGKLRSEVGNDDAPDKSDMIVRGHVDSPYTIKDIELHTPLNSAPHDGQTVRLDLTYYDGHTGTATMVWQGKRWYVDLPLQTSAKGPAAGAKAAPAPDAGAANADAGTADAAAPPDAQPGSDTESAGHQKEQ